MDPVQTRTKLSCWQFCLQVRRWVHILVYNKHHSAKSPCKRSGPSPTSYFNQDLWVWLKDRGRRFVSALRADVRSVADVSVHSFHTFTAWDNNLGFQFLGNFFSSMLQHLCDSCRYKQELSVSFLLSLLFPSFFIFLTWFGDLNCLYYTGVRVMTCDQISPPCSTYLTQTDTEKGFLSQRAFFEKFFLTQTHKIEHFHKGAWGLFQRSRLYWSLFAVFVKLNMFFFSKFIKNGEISWNVFTRLLNTDRVVPRCCNQGTLLTAKQTASCFVFYAKFTRWHHHCMIFRRPFSLAPRWRPVLRRDAVTYRRLASTHPPQPDPLPPKLIIISARW